MHADLPVIGPRYANTTINSPGQPYTRQDPEPLQMLSTLTILRLQQYTFLAQKPCTKWVIW